MLEGCQMADGCAVRTTRSLSAASTWLAMFCSPIWFGCRGNATELGTIPLTHAVPGGLQASCPTLEVNVSTYLAPFAAASCWMTAFSICSSELKYLMSPEESGTSGQHFEPLTGRPSGYPTITIRALGACCRMPWSTAEIFARARSIAATFGSLPPDW